MKKTWTIVSIMLLTAMQAGFSQGIIADHTCIDIYQIPVSAIQTAKEELHIGYGYTSHGSQITGGMSALVDFMNSKGYENNLFAYSQDGSGSTLHLFSGDGYGDGALDHDAGYYPDWVNETEAFLGTPNAQGRGTNRPRINVIMWSWCGQLSGYSTDNVYDMYLDEMDELEEDYPGITFVYMTGHSDGSGLEGDLHRNNQTIRNYCISNDKVLFDFYDIECYDPDGNYFGDRHVDDACNYDGGGNWAQEWQNAHTEGVDWFYCDAAHTESVNGNMKAYAIWWLWARLGGWAGAEPDATPPSVPQNLQASAAGETQVNLTWNASSDAESGVARYRVYRDGTFLGSTTSNSYSDDTCIPGDTYEYRVSAINGGGTESAMSSAKEVTLQSDSQAPSIPEGLTANPVSSTQINLSWEASTDNSALFGYVVYRNGILTAQVTGVQYQDTGLTPNTTYQYRVSAVDIAGNDSDRSGIVSASTLDPSQIQNTVRLESDDEVDDTFIYANDASGNYGGECCPGEIDRMLVKFNLPEELNGKQILSAEVGFYVWNQTNYHDNEYLKIYPVTRAWEEYEATWQNAADTVPWTLAGGDADMTSPVAQILHLPDQSDWDHVFYPAADITSLVQEWTDGTRSNHGLMVVNDGETEIGFKASEYGEGTRPYLEIVYTDKSSAVSVQTAGSFRLAGNFPNPFNPSTVIRFGIDKTEKVDVTVFDLQGRKIRTLLSGILGPGSHEVRFSAEDLESGIYVYTVRAGENLEAGKMLLVR